MARQENRSNTAAATPQPYDILRRLNAAPRILPVIDHVESILSGALTQVIPLLDLTPAVGSEWAEGRVIESYSVNFDGAAILPALRDFMDEFPGMLHALGSIHSALTAQAAADLGHPERSPSVQYRTHVQADVVNAAIRDQVAGHITGVVQQRLAALGMPDLYGIHTRRITTDLVDSMARGTFWKYDHSKIVPPDEERELEQLLGHPLEFDWLAAGLQGNIPD